MTREEAIADIRDYIKPVVGGISLDMAIKSLEADRAIEKTLYAIKEEMQFIKVAELQIYGANSWRFSNAIEEIIDKHLSEVSE